MAIKRSAGQEVQALIAELDTEDEVRREAAVARLSVIGTRAVEKLLAILAIPGPTRVRVSALHALESIGDARALPPALLLLDSPDNDVAAAAVGVARAFLHSPRGNDALDRLVSIVLDTTRPDMVRSPALDALQEMGSRVVRPVWQRLRDDPSAALRQRAARATGKADPQAELEAAASGAFPDAPDALAALLRRAGEAPALPTLHRLVELAHERERRERSKAARAGWLSVRGTLHRALAERQSRVALYDLRETIAAADSALPADFVLAAAAIGDPSSLEAIAAAYARSMNAGQSEWMEQLRAAFDEIARRESVGPRTPVIRRIQAKWPDAAKDLVSTPSRSKRVPRRASRT